MNRKILRALLLPAVGIAFAACSSSNAPVVAPSDPASGGSTSARATEQATPGSAVAQVRPLPFNAGGLLGGNAQPKFQDGEPGIVSVVQIGPLNVNSGTLPFAFRNNTREGIAHVDWTGTATVGGKIVATGSSQGAIPAQVKPGEVGLAYIYFGNSKSIPKEAKYEFTAETSRVDTSSFNSAPIKVTQATVAGGSIVGGATNQTGAEAQGPYSVQVYCFKGDAIQTHHLTFAEQDGKVASGGKVTFSLNLYDDTCQTFTVGVDGYFS